MNIVIVFSCVTINIYYDLFLLFPTFLEQLIGAYPFKSDRCRSNTGVCSCFLCEKVIYYMSSRMLDSTRDRVRIFVKASYVLQIHVTLKRRSYLSGYKAILHLQQHSMLTTKTNQRKLRLLFACDTLHFFSQDKQISRKH